MILRVQIAHSLGVFHTNDEAADKSSSEVFFPCGMKMIKECENS